MEPTCGLFLIQWRLAIKLSVQFQILVIRFSHWYAFMFRNSVTIQEDVFNHANKLFWRSLWHHVWVNMRLLWHFFFFNCFGFRSIQNNSRMWSMQTTWTCGEGRLQTEAEGLLQIAWKPRQSRHPSQEQPHSDRYFWNHPAPQLMLLWEMQNTWFWLCGNLSPTLRTFVFLDYLRF